jgi:hypothetical protein
MTQSAWHAWPRSARPKKTALLRFGEAKTRKGLRNLSAAARIDSSLFLGADEHGGIDRLTHRGQSEWAGHRRFELADLLPLADPDAEVDIEGLAVGDGWLWVLGSHARTRAKPEKLPGECIDLDALADLKDTRARCLLARLPLIEDKDGWTPVAADGERRAGMLPQDATGNALARALADDPLVAPFSRIPAKEGGLDIEGIAVCGSRVALGLRGPVIGTHALLLELDLAVRDDGTLAIAHGPVRRLLAMEGLGIRDLKRLGDDLLVLAGPTTGLSGPCAIYRWSGWANDPARDPHKVRLHRPERVLDLPFGRGCDHPEGLAAWRTAKGNTRVMVVHDSPCDARVDADARTIVADVFVLK